MASEPCGLATLAPELVHAIVFDAGVLSADDAVAVGLTCRALANVLLKDGYGRARVWAQRGVLACAAAGVPMGGLWALAAHPRSPPRRSTPRFLDSELDKALIDAAKTAHGPWGAAFLDALLSHPDTDVPATGVLALHVAVMAGNGLAVSVILQHAGTHGPIDPSAFSSYAVSEAHARGFPLIAHQIQATIDSMAALTLDSDSDS